jgi:hypothetical protein
MRVAGSQARLGMGGVAALALGACFYLAYQSPRETAAAYLSAYLFFLAPALGSLVLLMLHVLTGGRWGLELRKPLLAALRVLPTLAILLVPLLVCAVDLYPWAHPGHAPGSWYLNIPFFLVRGIVCFGVWLWLARGLRMRVSDGTTSDSGKHFTLFAAVALVGYLFTITIAATDWVMSLTPHWHSDVFGLTIGTSQVLSATALAAIVVGPQGASSPHRSLPRDLGRLLLMLVLVWAYLVFMDFLTAWIADLPDETAWYLPRLLTGWRWLGTWIVLAGLVLPFGMLLSPQSKRSSPILRTVGALLLLSQAAYCIWVVLPSVRPEGWALSWRDLLPWIGVGGVCWVRFDGLLDRTPRSVRATG